MPKKSIPPDGNVFQGVRTIVHVPAAKREKFLRRGRKWLWKEIMSNLENYKEIQWPVGIIHRCEDFLWS